MKRKIVLNSSIAKALGDFIKLKQLAGYDYNASGLSLMRFDQFLSKKSYNQNFIDENIVNEYLKSISYLHIRGQANYYGALRLFSIWLKQYKEKSFILEKKFKVDRCHSRPAYIFSHEQIREFLFKSKYSKQVEKVHNLYYVLFSLLYSTGIRINEALSINVEDYKVKEKVIHIKNGKFKKERFLVLSKSMDSVLSSYISRYKKKVLISMSSPLFVGMGNRRLIYNCVQPRFKSLLKAANIPMAQGYEPRIHDVRHTMAVHCLLRWYKKKENIYNKLPYLSTYMGHVKITSTQVYLHATSDLLQYGSDNFHYLYFNKPNKEKQEGEEL